MSTGSVADSRGWHECDLVERAKQIASGSVLELACASRCRDYAVSDISSDLPRAASGVRTFAKLQTKM